LKNKVDTLLVIPNDKILSLVDKNDEFRNAIASSSEWSKWIDNNKELTT